MVFVQKYNSRNGSRCIIAAKDSDMECQEEAA